MDNSPLDFEDGYAAANTKDTTLPSNIAAIVQQELMRTLKGKKLTDNEDQTHFAHFKDYSGMYTQHFAFTSFDDLKYGYWIIDTGASNHICTNSAQMSNLKLVTKPTSVLLPDGSSKVVKNTGTIAINHRITLTDVLHIPTFKLNLLSVPKLCQTVHIKFVFYPTYCLLQDLKSNRTLAVGKLNGKLYILDDHSFMKGEVEYCNKGMNVCNLLSTENLKSRNKTSVNDKACSFSLVD
ncbi:Uncharacterized protein Adt_00800 [Abeliophyllum distichum]|uniref:Retrovirus-related Pol polyprotein from transposon TNT 1-94-like beta-barrel domain-containing protein n=1 Tax=Abeliophyllum distichum TaxID=126358 RepID=A0ABD1VR44_9LAMI